MGRNPKRLLLSPPDHEDGSILQYRSITRPFFSRRNPAAFDPLITMEPHTRKLLDTIMPSLNESSKSATEISNQEQSFESSGDNSTVDVQSLFLTYTLDVATDFFFGECVNGLDRVGEQPVDRYKTPGETEDRPVDGDELACAFAEAQVRLYHPYRSCRQPPCIRS
jgi:hypothetical protein